MRRKVNSLVLRTSTRTYLIVVLRPSSLRFPGAIQAPGPCTVAGELHMRRTRLEDSRAHTLLAVQGE